ncbi:hypothetical protein [Nocardia nova]|uniref:hypothetical protein n=1 Tax=Nocardia nova TaxID=37330 RepID=UPI0033CB767F
MGFFDSPEWGALAHAVGRVAGHVLTSVTQGRDPNRPADAGDVQTRFNNTRDDVRGKARAIGFEGSFRNPSVQATDNFEKFDLAGLRTRVDQISLDSVNGLKDAWNKIGSQETTSLTNYQQAWQKVTNDGVWRGESKNSAVQKISEYTTQASNVSKAAELTGNKLAELVTGLDPTKSLVPHVPGHRTGVSNAVSLLSGRNWRDDVVAYDNAYAEAKRVLTTVYAPVVHESDTGVPVIPKPNEDKPSGPGDQLPPTPGLGPGPSSKVPGQPVGDGGDPTKNQNPDQNPNAQDPNSQSPQSDSNKPGDSPNAGDQGPTSPAAATNAAGFDPSSMGGGMGTPGGLGGGLGGGTGSGTPGHGSAVPGVIGVNAAGNAARAAGAGKAGTSGMPGMGGMGRGGKGEKEDERTKKTADYLINQENGDELTGIPSLPKTIPPVIGE